MSYRLLTVSPMSLGIVLGITYGLISIVVCIVFAVSAATMPNTQRLPMLFIFFFPIIYAFFGFVAGLISAAVYNLVAKWTGGVEFSLTPGVAVASLPDHQ